MKIEKVQTFVHDDFPNIFHVEITTDTGLVGLGESYYFGSTLATFANEYVGPTIIGRNPLEIEEISKSLTTYVGHNGSGVETRVRAAVDIALWDIAAKDKALPLYRLLGGKSPKKLRIYNTCAGRMYMRKSNQGSSSWGLENNSSQYEDLKAFMNNSGALAVDLLSEGITAMKIWPFDVYAEKNWGEEISDSDLESGVEVLRNIRRTVGNRIDIMLELHALWNTSSAIKIFEAISDLNIFWVEDPLHPDLVDELSQLRKPGFPKIAHGETVASLHRVQTLTSKNLIDYLTLDIGWCGGITQALKFADLARQNEIEIAPHDCTGPVGLTVGAHLSTADSNAVIQETVRSSYRTWYPHLAKGLPRIEGSTIQVNESPGHGLELTSEFKNSAGMKSYTVC
jgi:L-alanine-DL-glutamate epimerase-like enolase superfamily enzyme